ncbi:hypothetical protein LTR56_012492 [Elasticomyces elasticus]|nr:hypothetical protein LTR56_012492 [Elasticomyces elasticus]KAK3666215.1 hypothetical protein LTR22_002879 [Elasticomyces elasticus]KAK4926812.1 hypothetical protein LTR49_006228 [Elasticomyces elasticus]KAK5763647.1 hypothetical protein LTS12_006204 [Elasticomyces elasticus]
MGKAYTSEQREQVRQLLEVGRDEDAIERETGVSDRTIRRWKLELERTGRIGKPPESRTGRHRVLNKEVEAALFAHVADHPDMSVDDMLWWLYETHQIVVGTRTIRRVFERKGDKVKGGKTTGTSSGKAKRTSKNINDAANDDNDEDDERATTPQQPPHYQSPYAPMLTAEQQLAQALGQQMPQQNPYPAVPAPLTEELPDDEETIQLQLQQIELQKREVELKLKMRRLQQNRGVPSSDSKPDTPSGGTSTLFNPAAAAVGPTPPKRDSRSKKKIEESKKRTAERQERMLRELERRSRRRDHLTAEWVESKDIWPLRAQGMLADLMHRYNNYAYTPNNEAIFDQMYRDLYTLVDVEKGDWDPHVHDEMLRERMKRKMGQLRTKMLKTGEIVGRGDAYGGFARVEDYSGEAAGDAMGDETEMSIEDDGRQAMGGASQQQQLQALTQDPALHCQHQPQHAQMSQYEPVGQDHGGLQHTAQQAMPYGGGVGYGGVGGSQYPMLPQQGQHQGMMPYAAMNGHGHGQQQVM